MFRNAVLLTFITLAYYQTTAQQLYMPRNVQQAFKNNTRSLNGKPGKNYWQNHGRYNISIAALPPDRTIRGTEQITYTNNSPDTLKNLVFKLILNIHQPGAARLFPSDSAYFTSGIHIDSFVVNGHAQPWPEAFFFKTWRPVRLAQPLKPHDSISLSVTWHYDVSRRSGREGMLDSTTYYLAYFYPRVAVYDDYNGWDQNEFVDALEFYNDFNDYTFNVQVPKNYIVWATGTLLNPSAVLQPVYADKFKRSMTSDSVIHIATSEDLRAKHVTAQNAVNTWQWKATNVTDVALALSDHYVWDASSVVVDAATKRRASVQAAYNDTAADFHYMVNFGRHALDWFSRNWPGVPYPYEKTTIVQGHADMEYPMMVNDNTTSDTTFSKFVAEHEIAHTYMPFYMGINEAQYGFMDEGWATTFEYLIGQADAGPEKAAIDFKQFRIADWINDPDAGEDLPIITPGTNINGSGLGNNEYGKASLGYLAMKDLLGDGLFKKCLHEYMNRWHGKHPIPWDFFNTFSDASGQNLNWFWNNWYFSHYYIDLAIQNVAQKSGSYTITVQNIGGMAAPFDVLLHYTDGTTESKHETPGVWKQNQKACTITVTAKKKVQSITLDGGIFMDANEVDNLWLAK